MNLRVIEPASDLPPRRAFDVHDVRRMMDVGVIGGDERFELIEGEIVVMSPKSIAHDRLQNELNPALVRVVPEDHYIGNGSTLQLAENTLIEPDLAVLPRSLYAPTKRVLRSQNLETSFS